MITIIAAVAKNGVIGSGGGIPWDLPDDRRRFQELTWGHILVMGRRTFESIGVLLPGRQTVVITRSGEGLPAGCRTARSLAEAIEACGAQAEIFVCGGEEVYREALAVADRLELTLVGREFEGDAHFPPLPDNFVETGREEADGALPHAFVRYERIEPGGDA